MAQVKKGMFILYKNTPCVIVDFTHHAMGRGRGILNLKLKDLKTGNTLTLTIKSAEQLETIEVSQKNFQYLYNDQNYAYFMDPDTFEQVQMPIKLIKEAIPFLKEGEIYQLYLYEGKPVAVNLPKVITLKVVEAPPGVKGDSSSNPTKDVVLETGLRIKAPLFIKEGDLVKVNTESKEYVERV